MGEGTGQQKSKVHVYLLFFNRNRISPLYDHSGLCSSWFLSLHETWWTDTYGFSRIVFKAPWSFFFIIIDSPLRIPFISTSHLELEEGEHKMDYLYYTEGNMNLEQSYGLHGGSSIEN